MTAAPTSIAIVGTGYVGLTTGACLAQLGHHVICADIDADKIALLNRGEIPIVEEGLAEVVAEARAAGRLEFVVGAATAAADADIVFLCVPTPQGDDGSADLSYIQAAATEIGPALRARLDHRQQVDRAGRLDARRRGRGSAATTSMSCRTPSSSARARRSATSCTPTVWSSAPATGTPPNGSPTSTPASTPRS